jgi:hypothetical protein
LLAQRSPGEVWGMVQQFVRESGLRLPKNGRKPVKSVSEWQPREDLNGRAWQCGCDEDDAQ